MPRPFTQWQTEMAVFHADENGWPLSTLAWIGSCESKLEVTQGFGEERAETPGVEWADYRLLEEEHALSIENLWTLADALPGSGQLVAPASARNQRFVVVLIWTDEVDGFWIKRTYFNAQFNPFIFGSAQQYFDQRISMKAGWMFEETGRLTVSAPSLVAEKIAFVRYISPTENLTLYRHDLTTHVFTAVATTTGRATVNPVTEGGHSFNVKFNGTKMLGIDAVGGVHVKFLTAGGATFVAGRTRVEFMVGPKRVASLASNGEFAYSHLTVTGANPNLADDFELRDASNTWLASLDRTGLRAASVAADL